MDKRVKKAIKRWMLNTMDLQVLVATMNQTDHSLLEKKLSKNKDIFIGDYRLNL